MSLDTEGPVLAPYFQTMSSPSPKRHICDSSVIGSDDDGVAKPVKKTQEAAAAKKPKLPEGAVDTTSVSRAFMGLPDGARIWQSIFGQNIIKDAVVVNGVPVEISELPEDEAEEAKAARVFVEESRFDEGNLILGEWPPERLITNTRVIGKANCIFASMDNCIVTGDANAFAKSACNLEVVGSNNDFRVPVLQCRIIGSRNRVSAAMRSSAITGKKNVFKKGMENSKVRGSKNKFKGRVISCDIEGDKNKFGGDIIDSAMQASECEFG